MPGIKALTTSSLGVPSSTTNSTSNLYKDILRYLDLPEPLFVAIVAAAVLLVFVLFILLCSRCCFKRFRGKTGDNDKYKKRNLDIKQIESILNDKFNNGFQDRFGKISFAMNYDLHKDLLIIKIIGVEDLPTPMDGSLDTYVVTQLKVKDKDFEEKRTRIKMRTDNPVFNEKCTFKLTFSEFTAVVMVFKVYDYDKFGADLLLGQVTLSIDELQWDEMLNSFMEVSRDLEQGEDLSSGMGQICVILNNLGQMGLSVTILEAKDIRVRENSNYSHTFVTVKLKSCHNSKTLKTYMKKRTKECPCTKFPYFNESFLFPKPHGSISDCRLSLKIWVNGPFKMAICIGYLVLGSNMPMESGGLHWESMLDNPRHPIAKWHVLKNPSNKGN